VARRQHLASQTRAVLGAVPLSRFGETLITGEIDEPGLPCVQVTLIERLLEPDLLAVATDAIERLIQVIVRRADGAHVGQAMQRLEQPIDGALAIERRPRPWLRKVAEAGQRPARATKPFDWTGVLQAAKRRPARSSQGPPPPLRRGGR